MGVSIEGLQVRARDSVQQWLSRGWWLLFPSFALLTFRLAVERTCAEPYDLLPALASKPAWAWPIAGVYVLAHVWVVGAYVLTVSRTDTLVPSVRLWNEVWGAEVMKLALMLAPFAIEYAPLPIWRAIGAGLKCSQ
jgi:hypothetical protein